MIIKRIGIVSLAKLMGVLYAAIGLLVGGVFALFSLLGGGAMMASGEHGAAAGSAMMLGFGIGAVVIFPIMYGVLGFLGGLLTGWLFNLTSGITGGLELEVA